MSTARKILGNTAIQVAGKIITAAISIVIIKLLSGYLGLAGFGQYTTVYEFLSFFGIAADFGIFQIAVREMSRDISRREQILGNVLALRTVLTIGSMLVATGAVWLIPKYSDSLIPLGVAIAACTTFFTLLTGTLSSALQVEMQMSRAVLAQVIGKFVALGYMLWVIFWGYTDDPQAGFYQLLVAGNLGNGAMLVLTYLAVRQILPVRLRFEWHFWREVLAKALPYGTAIILSTIYFRMDVILIGLLRNQQEVGVYGVAMRVVENLQMLPVFFLNSTLPALTKLFAEDLGKLRQLLQHSFDFLVLLGVPIVAGGAVLAYPLIAVVASPEFLSDHTQGFYGSDLALRLLLIAMLFAFITNLFQYTLLAAGQQLRLLWIAGAAVVFNLVSNILVIPEWGFRGAALTSIISELIVFIASFYFVWQLTDLRLRFVNLGKIIFAASCMAGAVWYLEPISFGLWQNKGLAVLIPLGGAIFVGLLFATRGLTTDMLRLLRKPQA